MLYTIYHKLNFEVQLAIAGRRMWLLVLLVACKLLITVAPANAQSLAGTRPPTICNPLNLSYRFSLDKPSRREAADPTTINFKGEYYLFASKSGGYWHSTDLVMWDFITSADLPWEDYAPTAVAVGDTVYFMASTSKQGTKIYKSGDLKGGKWTVANPAFPLALVDPDLFLDTDGRLYLYYGCSNVKPIYGVELDRRTLRPLGAPVACFGGDAATHGWERFGDYNERPEAPWIEGAWMTKYQGKYYLQYASPGTEFKSYCDGMYLADSPLGPFRLAANNPFSAKPEGFIASAGHSSTFQDNYGNFWRISTMSISVTHRWERRLGLFPAFFGAAGAAYTHTGFGDFPFIIPTHRISSPAELAPGWMLLSYNKPVTVSSSLPDHPARHATDENIRTWWSAATGTASEWLRLDLQASCLVQAVQLNFAEQDAELYGRSPGIAYRYRLDYSLDGTKWYPLVDKSANQADAPHDYLTLRTPVRARYLRLTNLHTPSGKFALSGFRVFGTAATSLPPPVAGLRALRDAADPRQVHLSWQPQPAAIGYNVRYGTAPDRLYHSYQVFKQDSLEIRSLEKNASYYFTIDSFNERGVRPGASPVLVK